MSQPVPSATAEDQPITGRNDLQVDAADVERIGRMVRGPFRGDTPNELTHLLRSEPGDAGVMTYRTQMQRPVDTDLVDTVVAWVGALAAMS